MHRGKRTRVGSAARSVSRVLALALALALSAGLAGPVAHAQSRQLVGAGGPVVLQPLPGKRALSCSRTRCSVYALADGSFTATGAVNLSDSARSAAFPDGSVLVVESRSTGPTMLWSSANGQWASVAALPERTENEQLGVLSDGRVLLASLELTTAVSRLSLYVTDSRVSAWQRVARVEQPGMDARVSLTRSGVVFGTHQPGRLDITRYDVALDRWQPLASLPDEKATLAFRGTWNEAVFVAEEIGPSANALRELRSGNLEPIPTLSTATSVGITELRSTEEPRFAEVELGAQRLLWKRSDAPATPMPDFSPHSPVVTLDEYHLLTSDGLGTWLITVDQTPARANACAGLERVFQSLEDPRASANLPSTDNYRSWIDLVDSACKPEYERGQAPALAKRLHDAASSTNVRQRVPARIIACALHDASALESLPSWLDDERSLTARAACFDRLLEWPEAAAIRKRALAQAVRGTRRKLHVDPAILLVSSRDDSPIILDRLTPVLYGAAHQHAAGLDRLYANLCRDRSGAAGPERINACESVHDEREAASNHGGHHRHHPPCGHRHHRLPHATLRHQPRHRHRLWSLRRLRVRWSDRDWSAGRRGTARRRRRDHDNRISSRGHRRRRRRLLRVALPERKSADDGRWAGVTVFGDVGYRVSVKGGSGVLGDRRVRRRRHAAARCAH
jgi:hypothetical protein